ncbi:trypsin-like isoform X2 [Battus philenor]|uniref:trypsin-like isoform X2 n=1 Tax=Battus philenor TaxID=42288 RepID=UPI0035D131E7
MISVVLLFIIVTFISQSTQRPRVHTSDSEFHLILLNASRLPDPKDIKIDIDFRSRPEKRKNDNFFIDVTKKIFKESDKKIGSQFPSLFLNDSLLPDPKDIKIDIDTIIESPGNFKRVSERKCYEYKQLTSSLKITKRGRRRNLSILGGQNANIQDYPHMGALGWKLSNEEDSWIFLCGSSLISLNYVLTAAHCILVSKSTNKYVDSKPDIVRFGVTNIQIQSKHDFKLKRFIQHPLYQAPVTYFDIALIKLEREVTINHKVRPACIWSKQDLNGIEEVILSGWGSIDRDGEDPNTVLQSATVEIIDKDICKPLLSRNRNFQTLREHQICAGNLSGGVDSCEGDSGGPLQVKRDLHAYVVAVISFGHRCGLIRTPAIYTKVYAFIDWIELVVWGDELTGLLKI